MATNQNQYLINDLYLNPWRYVRVSVFGKKQGKAISKKDCARFARSSTKKSKSGLLKRNKSRP